MSTHNICFGGDMRKILHGYPILSGAMGSVYLITIFSGQAYCLVL